MLFKRYFKQTRLVANLRNEPFLSLQKLLGFEIRETHMYELALRHRSQAIAGSDERIQHNERLEFLGDAILNAIVSEELYKNYPSVDEGYLSQMRASIVKRETMNQVSRKLGLNHLLIMNKLAKEQDSDNIYGNALEALVGAIYIDKGFQTSKQFVLERIMTAVDLSESAHPNGHNYKSTLFEWCQERQLELHFKLISEIIDKQNRHHFKSQAVINNIPIATGKGWTKKESHQDASRLALEKVKSEKHFLQQIKST